MRTITCSWTVTTCPEIVKTESSGHSWFGKQWSNQLARSLNTLLLTASREIRAMDMSSRMHLERSMGSFTTIKEQKPSTASQRRPASYVFECKKALLFECKKSFIPRGRQLNIRS